MATVLIIPLWQRGDGGGFQEQMLSYDKQFVYDL